MTTPATIPYVGRHAFRDLIPGRLYQRGHILTWPRDRKQAALAQRRISLVINFWPKLDPDLVDIGLAGYFYLPVPNSDDMLSPLVLATADLVARHLRQHEAEAALVLCEAGLTRSVCFSLLVMQRVLGLPGAEVLARLEAQFPKHNLRPYMLQYFRSQEMAPAITPGARAFYHQLNDHEVATALERSLRGIRAGEAARAAAAEPLIDLVGEDGHVGVRFAERSEP